MLEMEEEGHHLANETVMAIQHTRLFYFRKTSMVENTAEFVLAEVETETVVKPM